LPCKREKSEIFLNNPETIAWRKWWSKRRTKRECDKLILGQNLRRVESRGERGIRGDADEKAYGLGQ
jgi:hypothetical protein